MIKIKISEKIKNELEKKHKNWYKQFIFPKLEETIEILDSLVTTSSLNKYRLFLKKIKEINLKFSILDDTEIKEVITETIELGLDWKKYNNEIEKLNKNIRSKAFFLKDLTKIKKSAKDISNDEERKKYIKEEIEKLKKYTNITEKIIKEVIKIFSKENSLNQDYYRIVDIDARKKLKKIELIFDYTLLYDKEEVNIWNRHKILILLGVYVCPYCQRNYIGKYVDNDEEKITADLDHFYSQSEFPFLSVCLYNFIPSCQICNSRMKSNEPTIDLSTFENIVINPLVESFDDYGVKFKLENRSTAELLDTKKKSLEEFKVIIENKSDNKKIQNTIDMFKLDKIYENNHSDYIIDMFESIRNRPDSYLSSIVEIFTDKKYFDDEKLKKEMLDNLKEIVLEPYKFKVEKGEPLGKLTKDILEEFGIDI